MPKCGLHRVYTGQRQGIQTTRRDGHDGHVNAHLLVQFLGIEGHHRSHTVVDHGVADEHSYIDEQ